jgi:hypothetical protein
MNVAGIEMTRVGVDLRFALRSKNNRNTVQHKILC